MECVSSRDLGVSNHIPAHDGQVVRGFRLEVCHSLDRRYTGLLKGFRFPYEGSVESVLGSKEVWTGGKTEEDESIHEIGEVSEVHFRSPGYSGGS